MPTEYNGTLRARVTLIEGGAKIEWFDPQTMETVWTETCTPRPGMAFVSQIECSGEFHPRAGFFMDGEGKRHFVLHADPGELGAVLSR
jgi:hypothetical protein